MCNFKKILKQFFPNFGNNLRKYVTLNSEAVLSKCQEDY